MLLIVFLLLTSIANLSVNAKYNYDTVTNNDAEDFVKLDQQDRGEDLFAAEKEMIKQMMEDNLRQETARREWRRRIHLSFLETHQRISERDTVHIKDMFSPSIRADYLRMRRIIRQQNDGGTFLEDILTLVLWTIPFITLLVWQFLG
ncbi:uncharacterized protein TM35_000241790 [Trypanosoma theileri]|uniref:Uncharacterized protein n=1 Tax=Trypanosoma theileri TaxID=67003 RepID=A0A1X0NS67_9TRYP|nr:uncharacterized protein TM35_000241790 [Trypanosoma theileri]ORC87029.1 hypothetical protein TM35_000241790 [Trypanosoma theileri]